MASTEPRFIVDANVGRLAKWLRALGYDTAYIPNVEDGDLVQRALAEKRVVVTRDAHLLRRRVVALGMLKVVLVTHDRRPQQLRQVVQALRLETCREFTRCMECNVPLAPVAKEEVRDRLRPYVYRTQEEFMECPQCRRVYWRGTHWSNMRADLAEAFHGR